MTLDYTIRVAERVASPKRVDNLKGKFPQRMDPNLSTDTVVLDAKTHEPVLGYLRLPDVGLLRRGVLSAKMTTTYRAGSGTSNISRTFGMAPRKPTQWREGCAPTSLSVESPEFSALLVEYAQTLAGMMQEFVPKHVQADKQTIQQVLPEWRLSEDALWTSGVINKTSQLPYHRDGFNFDAWSAMPVLRRSCEGGHLHVPEYDLVVACRDGYGVFFNGFRLLHGVTPIHLTKPDGYRFSVVYYALKGMKDCFTHAMEQSYARQKRTARERVE